MMKRGLSNICYGFFSTLANPTRLAILETLKDGPMNVSSLAGALRQEQSMISHNLRLLETCNYIMSERRGKEKVLSLNEDTVDALFNIVEKHGNVYCQQKGLCPNSK